MKNQGYILMEVLVALAIFGLAVVGLMRVLNSSIEISNDMAFDTAIRYGLQSILTEARHRDVANMNLEQYDEVLEVTYRTEAKELSLSNAGGNTLGDLYVLRATATWERGDSQEQQAAEIWIHKRANDER